MRGGRATQFRQSLRDHNQYPIDVTQTLNEDLFDNTHAQCDSHRLRFQTFSRDSQSSTTIINPMLYESFCRQRQPIGIPIALGRGHLTNRLANPTFAW